MDTIRKVHAPWKEPKRYVNIKWQPGPADQYKGPSGCPLAFPLEKGLRLSYTAESLA